LVNFTKLKLPGLAVVVTTASFTLVVVKGFAVVLVVAGLLVSVVFVLVCVVVDPVYVELVVNLGIRYFVVSGFV
jgi:hypothetical protein